MSDDSKKFLEDRRAKVEYTDLSAGLQDAVDQGVLDVLAKFRPQDSRTLQIEMLDLDEYIVYDYPDQHEFANWDEDQKGAKAYVVRKLRQLGLEDGETAVQEVASVAEALLHNYSIVNIDLEATHAGARRPQCFAPLGLNRALKETLGEI